MTYRDKKVLDIIPPNRSNSVNDFEIAHVSVKSRRPRYLLSFVIVIIGIVLVLSYFSLLKVTVEISPKYDKVAKSEDVIFDVDIKTPDYVNRRLPAMVVELSEDYSGTFSPKESVDKEEKAKGTVKIYNSTPNFQILVKDTRFLSSDGKLFRLTSRVTVPASVSIGGKTTPGTVDSEVVAVEAGESYNIEAATFSVPGFAGTAKYTSFYAKSFKPMAGGYAGKTGRVSDSDLATAKNSVVSGLTKMGEESVAKKLEEGLTLINGFKSLEFKDIDYSAKTGDLTDSFKVSGKINIKFIVIQNTDLEKLTEKMLNPGSAPEAVPAVLEGKKMIRQNSVKVEINPENPDLKSQKGIIHLTVSGEVYSSINDEVAKNAVKGKTVREAKEFLESQLFIDMVRINIKPFLIGPIPGDVSRINIEVTR
ncbi:MAG: hypothetical protein V1905_01035 [bacterium]